VLLAPFLSDHIGVISPTSGCIQVMLYLTYPRKFQERCRTVRKLGDHDVESIDVGERMCENPSFFILDV
jgi:hypothetical protein